MEATDASSQTAASALSATARLTVTKIHDVVSAGVAENCGLEKQLSVLAAKLQLFKQLADQLDYCYADASVVHRQLRDVVDAALADSLQALNALSILTGEWKRGSDSLDEDAVGLFDSFAAAYLRLFSLGTQLLLIETEQEQQAKLASRAAAAIVDAARNSLQGLLSFRSVTAN